MNKSSRKQTIMLNFFASPQSFHPHLVSDIRTQTICKALYEGLTRITSEGKVEFATAKKVEISPCNKKYTFTLRDSKWSNGKKVTSYDFANAWKLAISSKSNCGYVKRLFLIKNAKQAYDKKLPLKEVGIYTPTDNQLVVELEHPAPYFLKLVADPIYSPIYNPNLGENPTIFNGPFVVENYKINKKLTLTINPSYWDVKTVRLKKVEISFIEDMQTAFSEYEKGNLNWIGSPFINLPDDVLQRHPKIRSDQGSAPFWIFCNTKNPKLQSANIRKALNCAIDRAQIIKYVISHQKALYNILPEDLSSISSEDLLKDSDKEKSLILFNQGLKEIGMSQENFHLTLIHSNAFDQQKIALYLKAQWEKILGIKVTLRKDDWNTFYSKIKSGDYEIGGLFICNLYDDPSYLMESFESSYTNYAGWENSEYQKHFSLAKQCSNKDQRTYHLQKSEKILIEEMPVIPIYNHAHLYVCDDRLMNFSAPKFNYADFKWAYFEEEHE